MDIKDVQKTITDRIANPLVTAFFLGFVIVNWEIFYLSFFVSADSLQGLNKIEYVQQYFAKMPWWELNLRLYIVPALSILFFYFGPMPWIKILFLN